MQPVASSGRLSELSNGNESRLKAWLLASRPKTLAASIVPVMMATALAYRDFGRVEWLYAFFALAGGVAIQVATNFINDALDFKRGADTHERIGPLRVTQAGLISADGVMRGAYVCFVIAALCGIPLIIRGGWPLIAIGLTSIACAYLYTGGPFPLAYHGLGEPFVMIFFGLFAAGGTYYVLTLTITTGAILCGVAAGSIAIVLLAINNLRDIATDAATNKKTMAVRLGEKLARAEIAIFALLPFISIALVAWMLSDWSLLSVLVALPLAVALVVRVYQVRGAGLNAALAMAGAFDWLFGILFVIGALIRN